MCGGGTIGSVIGGAIGTAIGGPAGGIIGAGLGGTAGGLASGESFGDSLKGGLISAGTAGVGQALGIGDLIGDALGNAFNFSSVPLDVSGASELGSIGIAGGAGLTSGAVGAAAPAALGAAPEGLGAAWGLGSPDLTQALDAFGGAGPDIAGAAVDTGFQSAVPAAVTSQALPAAGDALGNATTFQDVLGALTNRGGDALGNATTFQGVLDALGAGGASAPLLPAIAPAINVGPAPGVQFGTGGGAAALSGGGGSAVSDQTLRGIESDIDQTLGRARTASTPDISGGSEIGSIGIPAASPAAGLDAAALDSAAREGLGGQLPTLQEAGNVGVAPGVVPADVSSAGPWVNPDTGAVGAAPPLSSVAAGDVASLPGVFGSGTQAPTGIQKLLSSLGISSPGKLVLPAAALGYAALNQGPSKEQKALLRQAQQLGAQGQQLAGYLQNGTLPPGAQAGLDQAAASAKAAIRSQYAKMGLSGSTMERQALAAVDERIKAQGFAYAANLLNQGVSETGLSGQLYNYLINANQRQNDALSAAIANFVGSAAGGTQKTARA